jgi:hypothetical protein
MSYDPVSLEDRARKSRQAADKKQAEVDAKRWRGEEPTTWELRDIDRLRDSAASDEQTANAMRYGQSPTHENQSSLNNQAKRYRF